MEKKDFYKNVPNTIMSLYTKEEDRENDAKVLALLTEYRDLLSVAVAHKEKEERFLKKVISSLDKPNVELEKYLQSVQEDKSRYIGYSVTMVQLC